MLNLPCSLQNKPHGTIDIILQIGILWCLITFFSRSTNAQQSRRETLIVVIGMAMVHLVTVLLLGQFLGWFTVIIDIVVLYLLVDKVCGLSRRATINICVWYVAINFLLAVAGHILSIPVDAQ